MTGQQTAMSPASLDRQEAEQFCRRFEALFNVGDAAGMTACYADDARLLAENSELVLGRPAIEQFWRAAIGRARAAGAVRTIGLDDVISSGSLGYTLGTVTVGIPDGPTLVAKYAVIWQRDPDGRWRIAVDSSSPNPRQG
jgi:ketosteroid isomerase-like protein